MRRYQQMGMLDHETGELVERRLEHESGEARAFYADHTRYKHFPGSKPVVGHPETIQKRASRP